MTNISITNSKNNVGAYINDINLKNLDQDKAEEIKTALNQFGVIFIKKQNLNPESYQNFAKSIGQPVVYPRLKGLDKKFPFINVIERKPDLNDKRKSVIHLTALGMDWREVAKGVVIEFNEKIQSHFEKEEMDIFFAILKKINKIIDENK